MEDKNAFFTEICIDEKTLFEAEESDQQSLMRDVFGNFVVQMILEYGE